MTELKRNLEELRQRSEALRADPSEGESVDRFCKALVFITAHIFGAVLRCYVLVKFWVWFVMPLHYAIPAIGMLQFFALNGFYELFTFNVNKHKKTPPGEDEENRGLRAALAVFVPLISLLVGWIILKCM